MLSNLNGLSTTLLILLLAIILAFEIAMFVSVIYNGNISRNTKILWIVGMILIHPFVAIAYFFTDHNKA